MSTDCKCTSSVQALKTVADQILETRKVTRGCTGHLAASVTYLQFPIHVCFSRRPASRHNRVSGFLPISLSLLAETSVFSCDLDL